MGFQGPKAHLIESKPSVNNELFCLVLNVFCSLRKGRDRDFVAIQRTPSKKIKVQSDMPQIWDNKHQMGALRPVLVSTILKKNVESKPKSPFSGFYVLA